MTNSLLVGYARVNATPMLGIRLKGYFRTRLAEAVLDELEICAMALACGDTRMVMIAMDLVSFFTDVADELRQHIAEANGLPLEAVYLHATHTHTGPFLLRDAEDPLEQDMAIHSSRTPWTEGRGGLQSIASQRVGHA